MPPTVKLSFWLFCRLTEPCWTTVDPPFGPVMTQLAVERISPRGSVRAMPIEPVRSEEALGCGCVGPWPLEQPSHWLEASTAIPAPAISDALRTNDLPVARM